MLRFGVGTPVKLPITEMNLRSGNGVANGKI